MTDQRTDRPTDGPTKRGVELRSTRQKTIHNKETGQDQYNEEQKVSLGWEPKLRGKKNTNTE